VCSVLMDRCRVPRSKRPDPAATIKVAHAGTISRKPGCVQNAGSRLTLFDFGHDKVAETAKTPPPRVPLS
jgi:hypothetical protein